MGHGMRNVARSRLATLVALGLLLTGGVLAGLRVFDGGSDAGADKAPDSILQFVNPEHLASHAMSLSEPPAGYAPKISREVAEEKAKQFTPGVTVRETVLAHLSALDLDRMVWVVNLDPGSFLLPGPSGAACAAPSTELQVQFMLTFVDSETGELIETISQQAPPPEGWQCVGFPFSSPDAR